MNRIDRPPEVQEGILLVGHGTRDPAGIAEFFAAARLIAAAAGDRPLEACFLELAAPTIAEGVERLVARGAERIIVVPLLLFSAGHAKRDIPVAVAAAAAGHTGLTIRQSLPLECNPHVLGLSARRFREAVAGFPPVAADQTLVLLVGRGSFDADATAEMQRLARLRAELTPTGRLSVCFLAMQQPSLADALMDAAASTFWRIVVQPHLLFAGELHDQIGRELDRQIAVQIASAASAASPIARQWVLAAPLGPEPELAAAVMELIHQPEA